MTKICSAHPIWWEHSVGELGKILVVAGSEHDLDRGQAINVAPSSLGQPDLRVVVDGESATLMWSTEDADGDTARIEFEPGARHLFIWGRRPDRRGAVRSRAPQSMLARVKTLLAGH